MIEVREITKRYKSVVAVDNLSFVVPPGTVTGFLGPNGAGKSTTMRILLGLDRAQTGTAHINARPYPTIVQPLHHVGALLDANAIVGSRTARDHLHWLARTARLGRRRVTEVLEVAGLSSVSNRRISTFSLGMKQRLGLATALLGDPDVLILDEPVTGLDPDGVRWIRLLLRSLAAEGRTILLSGHLMSEMALTADRLIVVNHGQLLADTSVKELTDDQDEHNPLALEEAYLNLIAGSSS